MKNFKDFNSDIEFILTDIDDTLSTEGQLHASAYEALWKLHDAGLKIIPITGRPAGWCEMIARFWPVDGVIGENGGFYFRYSANQIGELKKMHRWFFFDAIAREKNQKKLALIQEEIFSQIPKAGLASDQFCRMMDLAIDFCEDVAPLTPEEIQKIVHIFEKNGAQAKVSSIHVNGWFGSYNKVSTSLEYFKNTYGFSQSECYQKCLFIGDSLNDEPMFEKFPLSVGVSNIQKFLPQMKSPPQFITTLPAGEGFTEFAQHLLKLKLDSI